MKVIVDTNVLIRAVVRDDERQAQIASKLLKSAQIIAVSLPCLCEFVWVLRRLYDFGQLDVSAALDALLASENVRVNRAAVDAGLDVLRNGGDFTDGLIAYEGNRLGADTFVSFDKKAVSLIAKQGQRTKLLA